MANHGRVAVDTVKGEGPVSLLDMSRLVVESILEQRDGPEMGSAHTVEEKGTESHLECAEVCAKVLYARFVGMVEGQSVTLMAWEVDSRLGEWA